MRSTRERSWWATSPLESPWTTHSTWRAVTTAEALRGTELYADRGRLPAPDEDEFYHADLIGLTAIGTDGQAVGTVRAVHDFGAGDILEIVGAGGPPRMLPFTREAVPEIDLAGGRLVIDPPAETEAKPEDDPERGVEEHRRIRGR